MGTLSPDQIAALGFAAVGTDLTISDRCSFYGAGAISIGSHVRIDDSVIITAWKPVIIGSWVHISAFAFLSGQFGIEIDDFVNISVRSTLLSGSDDFSGRWIPGVAVPEDLRCVQGERIRLARHTIVGAHSVVLPGVTLGEGAVVGALSLVKEPLAPWGIYAGIPARRIGRRERRVEELAQRLLTER